MAADPSCSPYPTSLRHGRGSWHSVTLSVTEVLTDQYEGSREPRQSQLTSPCTTAPSLETSVLAKERCPGNLGSTESAGSCGCNGTRRGGDGARWEHMAYDCELGEKRKV